MVIDLQTVISGLILLVVGGVARFVYNISKDVTKVVTVVDFHGKSLEDHDRRLRALELAPPRLPNGGVVRV